jgi:hypothetical protein
MTLRFGSQTPSSIKVGVSEIQRIYQGSQIVWDGANPIPAVVSGASAATLAITGSATATVQTESTYLTTAAGDRLITENFDYLVLL